MLMTAEKVNSIVVCSKQYNSIEKAEDKVVCMKNYISKKINNSSILLEEQVEIRKEVKEILDTTKHSDIRDRANEMLVGLNQEINTLADYINSLTFSFNNVSKANLTGWVTTNETEEVKEEIKEVKKIKIVETKTELAETGAELTEDEQILQEILNVGVAYANEEEIKLFTCMSINEPSNVFEIGRNYYNLSGKGILNSDKTFTVLKGTKMVFKNREKNYKDTHIKNLTKYKDSLRNVNDRFFVFVEDCTFSTPRSAVECIKGYTGIKGTPLTNSDGCGVFEYMKNRRM